MNKKIISAALGTLLALTLAVPAFADTNANVNTRASLFGRLKAKIGLMRKAETPTVVGSVTAISGTNITITTHGKGFMRGDNENEDNSAVTTLTIDASKAAVVKNNATTTVSTIAVGDMIMVKGTVSGTTITASAIRVGGPQMEKKEEKKEEVKNDINALKNISGNGSPVVAGTIASISGNTFTLTNSGSVTYTIDATNAKITVLGIGTTTASNIKVGDHVIVQGSVNGSSISAVTVIDQNASIPGNKTGFKVFNGIGGFIKHIFGF